MNQNLTQKQQYQQKQQHQSTKQQTLQFHSPPKLCYSSTSSSTSLSASPPPPPPPPFTSSNATTINTTSNSRKPKLPFKRRETFVERAEKAVDFFLNGGVGGSRSVLCCPCINNEDLDYGGNNGYGDTNNNPNRHNHPRDPNLPPNSILKRIPQHATATTMMMTQYPNQELNSNECTKTKRYIVDVPLHDFDLDMVHPSHGPYLGIRYWDDGMEEDEEVGVNPETSLDLDDNGEEQEQEQEENDGCINGDHLSHGGILLDVHEFDNLNISNIEQHHLHHLEYEDENVNDNEHHQEQPPNNVHTKQQSSSSKYTPMTNKNTTTTTTTSTTTPTNTTTATTTTLNKTEYYSQHKPKQRYNNDQLSLLALPTTLLFSAKDCDNGHDNNHTKKKKKDGFNFNNNNDGDGGNRHPHDDDSRNGYYFSSPNLLSIQRRRRSHDNHNHHDQNHHHSHDQQEKPQLLQRNDEKCIQQNVEDIEKHTTPKQSPNRSHHHRHHHHHPQRKQSIPSLHSVKSSISTNHSFSSSISPLSSRKEPVVDHYNNLHERKVLVTFTPKRLFGFNEEDDYYHLKNKNNNKHHNSPHGEGTHNFNHGSGSKYDDHDHNDEDVILKENDQGCVEMIHSFEASEYHNNMYKSYYDDDDTADYAENHYCIGGDDNHDYESDRSSSSCSNILNPTTLFLSTPKGSKYNYSDDNDEYDVLPSPKHQTFHRSDDTSIIVKNGILTKSPTSKSHKSPTTSCSTIPQFQYQYYLPTASSPCRSTTTDKSYVSIQTCNVPDGGIRTNRQSGLLCKHVNTLPSFQPGVPIRLKVTESYAGFSSGFVHQMNNHEQHQKHQGFVDDVDDDDIDRNSNAIFSDAGAVEANMNTSNISMLSDLEQTNFFSYDPYFSLGQYLISTSDNMEYGNGLSVKMGEQYMTLQDKDGRVYGVTRSRHTFIPSSVIYSSKARFEGQSPSSHRPNIGQEVDNPYHNYHRNEYDERDGGVELYPWVLAKKNGRRMDNDVGLHFVVQPHERKNGAEMVGGLFHKWPSYISRHGFDSKGGHSHTVVYRIEKRVAQEVATGRMESSGKRSNMKRGSSSMSASDADVSGGIGISRKAWRATVASATTGKTVREEIPCCIMLRDPIYRDVFDVTIAPGIDPLLIVCTMAAHFKMDVEPKMCDH